MKTTPLVSTCLAVAFLSAGSALAQGQRHGQGYGGPPQSDEERAARREQCQNPGTCDGSGPKGKGFGRGQGAGQGQGQGQGHGHRRGPRDGQGPRHGQGGGQ